MVGWFTGWFGLVWMLSLVVGLFLFHPLFSFLMSLLIHPHHHQPT
jgi:hypothetical protein